ncbi:ADP-ribosylation factor-like protein 9 [Latimeria chalumnae]
MSKLRAIGLLGVAAAALTGGVAYVAWQYYTPEGKPPKEKAGQVNEEKLQTKKILVLGLDGAGKTSIINTLATNIGKQSVSPTEGFNAVCINTEKTKLEFLEIGGKETLRTYWRMYLTTAQVLVYVVDSADHKRLPLAKQHLHQLIQEDLHLPLVVLANKQDCDGAYGITEIHEALGLSEVGDKRKLFLIRTRVSKDGMEVPTSIQDAKDLITQLVSITG